MASHPFRLRPVSISQSLGRMFRQRGTDTGQCEVFDGGPFPSPRRHRLFANLPSPFSVDRQVTSVSDDGAVCTLIIYLSHVITTACNCRAGRTGGMCSVRIDR